MSSGSHAVLALSASVAVAIGLALVPSATTADAAAAAVKVTKGQVAKLELDVAGYVEMRQFKDSTSSCSPGVTYTQTNRYTFETSKYVETRVTNVALPGTDGVMTSRFSRPAGSANITGEITGFRTTNRCAPQEPDPEPVPPTCVKTRGKTSVMLLPAVPLEVSEDDPVPLGGKRMMLSVARHGGAQDDVSCFGGFGGNISGTDTDTAIVGTSFAPAISLVLPTGLGSVKLFNLKRSDRLRRTIVVMGPCSSVRVSTYSGWAGGVPAPGGLNADGDCWLTAKIVLSVRRSR